MKEGSEIFSRMIAKVVDTVLSSFLFLLHSASFDTEVLKAHIWGAGAGGLPENRKGSQNGSAC